MTVNSHILSVSVLHDSSCSRWLNTAQSRESVLRMEAVPDLPEISQQKSSWAQACWLTFADSGGRQILMDRWSLTGSLGCHCVPVYWYHHRQLKQRLCGLFNWIPQSTLLLKGQICPPCPCLLVHTTPFVVAFSLSYQSGSQTRLLTWLDRRFF